MATTPFDSVTYRSLFHDAEVGKLLTDSAEVRAMMIALGALAQVQGRLGLIPEISGEAIRRASLEIAIDPHGLSDGVGQSAVPVPALVAAFRSEMQAPEHAQYLHYGATSQDIIDTGLALRLRRVCEIYGQRLRGVIRALGRMADTHADLPMAGRTYGQIATPTTFGAAVAGWGRPLLTLEADLARIEAGVVQVSLSGAAGTLSAMADQGAAVRAGWAEALALGDPGGSWHSDRSGIAALAGWITQVTASLGKIGDDLILATQSGLSEVRLGQSGGSSTMPQKQNPVGPSVLVALARHSGALNGAVQGAAVHRQQRDGAAWFVEWLSLGQMLMAGARSLALAGEVLEGVNPDAAAMQNHIDDGLGLIYAEALSFALAPGMGRPKAQAAIKKLCAEATASGTPLPQLAAARWPDAGLTALCTPRAQLGQAPAEARAFAARAKEL